MFDRIVFRSIPPLIRTVLAQAIPNSPAVGLSITNNNATLVSPPLLFLNPVIMKLFPLYLPHILTDFFYFFKPPFS